ncbi:MAG: HAD-IIIA family hydrolase [Bacteroidetes bacterium]|nr:HAD-IIIA family hydrolase [Bacteroidota bacterium]
MDNKQYSQRAAKIKILLTDVDGVLTDNGVFYGESGEVLKRFSIRDGMGVERLRKLAGVDTGIVTGELSPSVARRAEKLQITELHLGIKDKLGRLRELMERRGIGWDEIAYIGDDVNDLEVLEKVGLSACPSDAMAAVSAIVHYRCVEKGGYGAFREFAEWIITLKK